MSPLAKVLFVEHAFRQSAEESRHSVFQHFAARTEQVRMWKQLPTESDQIVFVPSGAMQKQQSGRVARRPIRRDESISETQEIGNHVSSSSISGSRIGGTA